MRPTIEFGNFWQFSCGKRLEDDDLIKSSRFSERKSQLSAYVYSLLRCLEFEACWLIRCPSSDFKILLGEKIGFDARFLEALHDRLFEKLTLRYLPQVDLRYSENFAAASLLESESEIAAFLYALSQDLYLNIQNYLNQSDRLADAPTCMTLKQFLDELAIQIDRLRPWVDRQIAIHPLGQSETVIAYSGIEEIPSLADFPGRSSNLQFSETSIVNHCSYADLMSNDEKLRRFSHYVYLDIEITAMEVCAKNIVAYRWMPFDFKLDMARQIWDEARHAIVMRRLLNSIDGKEGDYTYSAKVWKKCEKGSSLAERLAIQQVFQEGNALESNFLLTEAFRNSKHSEMTYYMDCINADEAVHVKIGNVWMQYLLGSDEAYQATMENAVSLIHATLSSNVAVNRTARSIAAFPNSFVETLEENNQVYGYRKS